MTDNELVEAPSKHLFKLSGLIKQKIITLDDIADIIPGIMHTNNKDTLQLSYVSQKGQDTMRYSLEEMLLLGTDIFVKHQSKYTLEVTYPKLIKRMSNGDKEQAVSFFQDWRFRKDEHPVFYLSTSKYLEGDELITISLLPPLVENLSNEMVNIFGNNKTFDRYYARYNSLTKREKEIVSLLAKEMTRKEVGNALFIDERTVKKHFENIFKKLGTNKRTELNRIAKAFITMSY